MKFMSFLFAIGLSLQASAWISTNQSEQTYNFKFRMKSEIFEVKQSSGSYEEAFEKAAQSCFQHFKGNRRVSEDQGLDIIDVCANPRTT